MLESLLTLVFSGGIILLLLDIERRLVNLTTRMNLCESCPIRSESSGGSGSGSGRGGSSC